MSTGRLGALVVREHAVKHVYLALGLSVEVDLRRDVGHRPCFLRRLRLPPGVASHDRPAAARCSGRCRVVGGALRVPDLRLERSALRLSNLHPILG